MPQGFYYDTWLHVAQSVINRGCASGLCTASCPHAVMPALPSAACNVSSHVQCYPVPADDSAFDKPTLRELELAHNQPISTRSCPPDPPRDGNIESPSPPSQPPARATLRPLRPQRARRCSPPPAWVAVPPPWPSSCPPWPPPPPPWSDRVGPRVERARSSSRAAGRQKPARARGHVRRACGVVRRRAAGGARRCGPV